MSGIKYMMLPLRQSLRRPVLALGPLLGALLFVAWDFGLPLQLDASSTARVRAPEWNWSTPSWIFAAQLQLTHASDALSWRRHLESTAAGHNYTLGSSRTSTFDNIYVLSLVGQTKRQEQMHKVARAHGLEFQIFNATSKDSPLIGWIAERVREVRDKKRRILAAALGQKEDDIGGMGADSIWFQEADEAKGIVFPDLAVEDQRWKLDGKAVNWTTYMASPKVQAELKPASNDTDVVKLLWDPKEPDAFRQHSPPIIATWHSHSHMWQTMLDRGDETALFLEDDVDFEWDFERLWLNVRRVLPEDQDMIFLGHCWARTRNRPMYLNPILREAAAPRCLHAYSLSAKGARTLLSLMDSPWIAYQSAIDLYIPRLTRDKRIRAFALEPPLIIQSKDSPSSIQPGTGNAWRGLLMDSTLDRIWRDEGEAVKPLTWEQTSGDPCIWNS